MPNVPNVPGVPPLSSYSGITPQLLVADAISAVGLISPPTWGIYLNGVPIILPASVVTGFVNTALSPIFTPIQELASVLGQPNLIPVIASTIDFEFRQDWPISDYPQEQGAFQSYNKVTLPYDVKVKLAAGGAPAQRQAFLSSCLGIANSFALFDIVTPDLTFTSCNATHIDWRRSARSGVQLIVVDLWFKKISVTSITSFSNTQSPNIAGQQSTGTVQPQAVPTASSSQVLAAANTRLF